MSEEQPSQRFRFGIFEADGATGELRRKGVRIKLNSQPFQVLWMMLQRPGELLTREEISRELWPDGTFVDYEHGVNSAVNRIREALGDKASNARFVETLARRGYRFVAPVERVEANTASAGRVEAVPAPEAAVPTPENLRVEPRSLFLASPEDLPHTNHRTVQTLFVLLQLMYLGFYVGALANLAEIQDLISSLSHATEVFLVLIATAAVMVPVRAFLVCAVLFYAPDAKHKLLKIWPFLLVMDSLWALAPFLLLHHINFGVATACTALLLYSPFAQRSLVLMGAGTKPVNA